MSWQFPYSLDHDVGKNKALIAEEKEAGWENFSLSVLLELIDQYTLNRNFDDLNLVYRFLKHKAIKKLLKNEGISSDEWSRLSAERWPHQKYPLPIALNKELKKAGRYLWVETDHFSLAEVFPSTRLHHKYLDDVIDQMGKRLLALENQCPYLPEEWAFYITRFIGWIRDGKWKRSGWIRVDGSKPMNTWRIF